MKSVYICLEDKVYLMNLVNAINNRAKGRFIVIGVNDVDDLGTINGDLLLLQEGIELGQSGTTVEQCGNKAERSGIAVEQSGINVERSGIKVVRLTDREVLGDGELKLYDKVSVYVDKITGLLNIKENDEACGLSCAIISLVGPDRYLEYVNWDKSKLNDDDKTLIWELLALSNYEVDEKNSGTESLFYSIKMRDDTAFNSINDILIDSDGIPVLRSPAYFKDIRELDRDDYRYCIDHLMREFKRVYALVDVGCLNEAADINEFDKIVVLSDNEDDNLTKNLKRLFSIIKIPNEKVEYKVL